MQIRKTSTIVEELHREGGRLVDPVYRVAVFAAAIRNPWAGVDFVQDLQPMIDKYASPLGEFLTAEVLAALRVPAQAYGKAGIVGINGELEHASALIHTLKFGNHFREATGGSTLLPAVEKRTTIGGSFDIPLKHIKSDRIRSHHQSIQVSIPDAPAADEILVALAASSRGRPQSRLASLDSEDRN